MTDPFSFEDRPTPFNGPRPEPSPEAPADRTPTTPKIPAPPLMGRAPRPSAVRIRKPMIQAMICGAALLLSGSLAWAFIVQPDLKARARDTQNAERLDENRGGVRPSEKVTRQPASYDRLRKDENGLPEPRGGSATDETTSDVRAPARVPAPTYGPSNPLAGAIPSPALQAAASELFFAPPQDRAPASSAEPDGQARPPAASDPTRQALGAIYSPHGLVAPISPYELKAGAIIPGVLLTAVDTARPGPVVATVSQNIFDSITGRHRLLPQGARLIGRHEGETAHGDRRAFLVWDRIILPNGKSLILTEEPGVDGAGAVGVRGQVDRRLWSLGIASLFAGAVTTLGELARGGAAHDRSVIASAGDAASIEASQVGGRLIDRELQVRPSIRLRAGTPVRVMITRDLILEPYSR